MPKNNFRLTVPKRLNDDSKLKKTQQIIPTLITTFGLEKYSYWQDFSRVLTLEHLFQSESNNF